MSRVTRESLLEVIQDHCELKVPLEQALSCSFVELGWDSLEIVSMMMALEDAVGVELDIDGIDSSTTLESILNDILRRSLN